MTKLHISLVLCNIAIVIKELNLNECIQDSELETDFGKVGAGRILFQSYFLFVYRIQNYSRKAEVKQNQSK